MTTDEGNDQNETCTLKKIWNRNSWTKLALSASWTHGLITERARASERALVLVASNTTQITLHSYLKKDLLENTININIFWYTIWLPVRDFGRRECANWWRELTKWNPKNETRMALQNLLEMWVKLMTS